MASVMETVYEPIAVLEMLEDVSPPGLQEKLYPGVPPAGFAVSVNDPPCAALEALQTS